MNRAHGGWSPVRADAAVSLALALLIVAWDLSGLDLAVARWFGSAQGFAWREHWLTATLLHDGARVIGWTVLAALALNVVRPLAPLRMLPFGARLRWLLATLAPVLVVSLMKGSSSTSCPWSLAEFGGPVAQFVPHWWPGVHDGGPGGCFPSGHAATAFAFVAGWFTLREHTPRAARWWLAGSVLGGALLGGVQVVRGAHYVSHPLWTAWTCWTTAALLARAWPAGLRLAPCVAAEPGAR